MKKIITSEPDTLVEYLKKIWQYRFLILTFAYQEIKVQYAQTYFGLLWAVIRPLVILVIFTVIFNFLLKLETPVPYYLFVFSGIIVWNLFNQIVNSASSAVLEKIQLIKKMYFPKMVLIFSKVILALVDFSISLIIFLLLVIYEDVSLNAYILLIPIIVLATILMALSIVFWMNSLNIKYRDLNQIMAPIIGIAIWFTPVFFPSTIIPEKYHYLIFFNPVAGIIEAFRFCVFGISNFSTYYYYSITAFLCVAIAGAIYFIKVEDEFVDYG